ncbi:MAG: hypothetical protein ACREXS_01710 [Gammaproteobacteria bacterium]
MNNLKKASLAVLLITTDLLRSEFVREQEMPLLLGKRQRKELIIIPVLIDQALVKFAQYKFPDPRLGPHDVTLSELQIESYDGQPISHLDRPRQNQFIDKLAQTILYRLAS